MEETLKKSKIHEDFYHELPNAKNMMIQKIPGYILNKPIEISLFENKNEKGTTYAAVHSLPSKYQATKLMSEGDTIDEAITNLSSFLTEWFENLKKKR